MEKMGIIHRRERSSPGHRVHFTHTKVAASKLTASQVMEMSVALVKFNSLPWKIYHEN